MKKESLEEFLARGGKVEKIKNGSIPDTRRHWTNKDKIDVALGNRKTGASKMFNNFAKSFLEKGNTSWKYGK